MRLRPGPAEAALGRQHDSTQGRWCSLERAIEEARCDLSLAFLSLFAQPGQAVDALKFYKSHFVTGDYVVGGVGLRGKGVLDPATKAITGISHGPLRERHDQHSTMCRTECGHGRRLPLLDDDRGQ